ncbi:MAG TPA: acyltransferase family protein [Rhizomicrobium sp.]|jgi:peptidoglycan/LPS O-acetylase OafA/YrhL|nr:acyltransferase family protein [Rhizomicrobium sp.]
MPQSQEPIQGAVRYRADIDGLRAVAVLPVLLFHYRVPGFAGGYVGVDVFFVISGYLITALLAGELRAGNFSLAGFYERRVRRIFPALFAVLFVTIAAAAVVLVPDDLRTLGKNMVAVALFAANFAFWNQTNYFSASASVNPILHTWSLAVEEQFYIVFPAFLFWVHNMRPALRTAAIGALALLSFLSTIYLSYAHPTAAFYLPMARGWELLLGALAALGAFPNFQARWLREVSALLGLALIAGAVAFLAPDAALPGVNLIVPCAGTVLILHAAEAETNFVSYALSWRPLVFVGLISYSLYLWHWPLWSFANYVLVGPPGIWLRLVLLAASFGLAVLSWRYIERPFRRDRRTFARGRLFAIAGAAMAGCIGFGLAAIAADGLPQRYPQRVRDILAAAHDFPVKPDCFERSPERAGTGQRCDFGDAKAAPSIALWGDSHALALFPAVDEVARKHGRKGLFMARSDCPPFAGDFPLPPVAANCTNFNRQVLQALQQAHIKTVILASRWAVYDQGPDEGGFAAGTADRHALFADMLRRTVDTLAQRGIRIVLVLDVPEIGRDVPRLMARDVLLGWPEEAGPTPGEYRARQGDVPADFAALGSRVTVLDPAPILCPGGQCAIARGGRALYRDDNHLTTFGAAQLEPMMERGF